MMPGFRSRFLRTFCCAVLSFVGGVSCLAQEKTNIPLPKKVQEAQPGSTGANKKGANQLQGKQLILDLAARKIEHLLREGKLELAQKELEKIQQLYLNETAVKKIVENFFQLRREIILRIAKVALERKNFLSASEVLQSYLKLVPEDQQVLNLLISVSQVRVQELVLNNQKKSAEAIIRQLESQFPQNPNVQKLVRQIPELPILGLKLHVSKAFEEKDFVKAETLLQEILELQPGERDSTMALVGLQVKEKRYNDATWVLNDYLQRNPHDVETLMLLGKTYYSAGKKSYALKTFRRVARLKRNHEDLNYWFGRILLDCDQPFEAISFLSCGPVSSEEVKDVRRIVRGTAFAQLGLQSIAAEHFKSAQRSESQAIAKSATEIWQKMDDAYFCSDRFRGRILFGTRHDNNPGVIPTTNAVGVPLGVSDSFGNNLGLNLSRDVWKIYDQQLTVGYNHGQTINYSTHQFDLINNQIFATHQKRFWNDGLPTVVTTTMNYDYQTLNGDAFLSRVGISPSVRWLDSDRSHWTLLSHYRHYNFLRQGNLAHSPFDLDANNIMVGVNRTRELDPCGRWTLSAEYQMEFNFANGTNFDYNSHRMIGSLAWKSPNECWNAIASNTYAHRDYLNNHSISGIRRDDNEWISSIQVQRKLFCDTKLYALWNFDLNNSNLAFNRYRRNIIEVGLTYGF